MSLFLAKKQEDANQKKVRDLLRLKGNKKCFDCPTKSPAFVNTTIQTFICSRCSGLVREVGHRVKAVSASKFSGTEVLALKQGGNGIALKIWLSNYSTHDSPEPESDGDVRAFMRQKYYENKWLDRALLQSHKEKVRDLLAKNFTEDGLPIVTKSRTKFTMGFARLPLIADNELNIMHDDEYEEEKLEPVHHITSAPASAPLPQQQVPEPYMNAHHPVGPHMPLASPPALASAPMEGGRTSMESSYSGYSSSSKGMSVASVHSGRDSQDMARINDGGSSQTPATSVGGSNRESLESSQSSSASATVVLTAEQIAERCKSTMGSDSPEAKAIAAAQLLAEQQKLEQEQYQQQQLQYQLHGLQQHQYPQQQPYQQQPYPQQPYPQQPYSQQPYPQQLYPQQPYPQQPYPQQPYSQQLYPQQLYPQQPYQQQSYQQQPHQQQPYHLEDQKQVQNAQQQSKQKLHNQQCVEAVSIPQDPYTVPKAQVPYTAPIAQDPHTVPEQHQAISTDKSLPPLRINVSRANKDSIYHQHPKNNQVKSPSSVGFGNNIQSPSSTIPGNASASASPVVTPSTSKVKAPASPFDSILSDLAGLKLEKTVHRATYTGGLLSPATPATPAISSLTPSSSTNVLKAKKDDKSASIFDHDFFSRLNKTSEQKSNPENDPYAALRGIPAPVVATTPEAIKEDEKNTSSSSEEEDDDWQEFCSSSSVGENDDFATAPAQLVQPTVENTKPTATNMISVDLFSDLDPRSMFKRF